MKMNNILNLFMIFLAVLLFSGSQLQSQNVRKVVFEEFTEVWCGPCASLSPMLSDWLENNPDIIPIMYTSYFKVNGNNVKVSEEDYNARKQLYNVPFYPYGRLNGDALPPNASYPGFPTDTSAMNAVIDTMTKYSPVSIEIDFTNNGSSGNVEVSILSSVDIDNKRLFVLLTEKHHTYEPQSNGMTEYHDIFRKTLTEPFGNLVNLKANETQKFNFDYQLSDDINFELNAIALLQSPTTKFILQSEKVFSYPTSVSKYDIAEIKIYPNPVIDIFSVNVNTINEKIDQFIIYDILGNQVLSNYVKGSANKIDISTKGINSGVYYLKIITNKNSYIDRIVIQ
jgi:thiol-disulfide isomerase/thioredoxin